MVAAIKVAVSRGFWCDLLCYRPSCAPYLEAHLKSLKERIRYVAIPKWYQAILNRSDSSRAHIRLTVWLASLYFIRRLRYRAAISLSDQRPFEMLIARRMPMLLFQATIDFFDLDWIMGHRRLGAAEAATVSQRLLSVLDRLVGGRMRPSLAGEPVRIDPGIAIVDYLFGCRPSPAIRGMGGAVVVAVGGPEYVEINAELGVPRDRLFASGLVEHDEALAIAKEFGPERRKAFVAGLSIPDGAPIVVFFGSKQRVLGQQNRKWVGEIRDLMLSVNRRLPSHWIVFKHHPKFADGREGFTAVREGLADVANLVVIDEHRGSRFNVEAILSADFVVTTGTMSLLAAVLRRLAVSFAISETQSQRVSERLRCTVHVNSTQEFEDRVAEFERDGGFPGLAVRQAKASERFFLADGEAAGRALDRLLMP